MNELKTMKHHSKDITNDLFLGAKQPVEYVMDLGQIILDMQHKYNTVYLDNHKTNADSELLLRKLNMVYKGMAKLIYQHEAHEQTIKVLKKQLNEYIGQNLDLLEKIKTTEKIDNF